MRTFRACSLALLALLPILAPSSAFPSGFKVRPTRLFLTAGEKTASLTLKNEGKDKATVQVGAFSWEQDEEGVDRYETTRDVVVFPRIAVIEGGKELLIRLGYEGGGGAGEKAYRLFFEELPISSPGEKGLRFTLRISVPLFITPMKETRDMSIQGLSLDGESLRLQVRNGGNVHGLVKKVKAVGLGPSGREIFGRESTGWYVLAGGVKEYTFTISGKECREAEKLLVEVVTREETLSSTLFADPALCPLPEAPGE